MKNKLLCLILSVALMFNTIIMGSVFVFADENNIDSEDKILLTDLGIINNKEVEACRENAVTRGDFAVFAARILGVQTDKNTEKVRYFKDVEPNSSIAPYINVLYRNGIVTGTDKAEFRPFDDIVPSDAATIMCRIADYHKAYTGEKLSNEVRKLTGGNSSDKLYIDAAIRLIYDALMIPMVQQEFGSGYTTYKIDKEYTVLYHYFNVYKVDGFLDGADGFSIDGIELSDNKATVDGIQYETKLNLGKYIGYDVLAYVKDKNKGDINEIVSVIPYAGGNNVTQINVSDLTGKVSSDLIIGYYDNKTERTKRIGLSKDSIIIKNGELVANKLSDAFDEKQGIITVIKSSNHTVVKIDVYDSVFVSSVSERDKIIYAKNGKKLELNREDVKRARVFLPDGNSGSISDIEKGMLLTVFRSKEFIDIYTLSEAVSGTLTAKDEKQIVIDNKKYDIEPSYVNELLNKVKLNDDITVYLNMFGEIAYYDEQSTVVSSQIGFLVKAIAEDDFDEKLLLKVFSSDGKMITLDSADKFTIDGTYAKPTDSIDILKNANNGYISQVIAYELNSDGKVKDIDTAAEGGGANGGLTLTNDFANRNYNPYGYFIYTMMLNKKCVVFQIPSIDEVENANDNKFRVSPELKGNTSYYCAGYSRTGDGYYTDVVLISSQSSAPVFSDFDQLFIVDELSEYYDEESEETKTQLTLGGSVSQSGGADMGILRFIISDKYYYVTDETRESYPTGTVQIGTDVNPDELGRGDLVRIVKRDNEIERIRRVFDYDDKTVDFTKIERYHDDQSSLWLGRFCLEYAVKKDGETCMFSRGTDYKPYEYAAFVNSGIWPIIVYDDTLKTNPVYLGSIDDIITAEEAEGECSVVCPILYEGYPRVAFVYKNGIKRN